MCLQNKYNAKTLIDPFHCYYEAFALTCGDLIFVENEYFSILNFIGVEVIRLSFTFVKYISFIIYICCLL